MKKKHPKDRAERAGAAATRLAKEKGVLIDALRPFATFAERSDGPVLIVEEWGKSHWGPGITAEMASDYVLVRLDPSCPAVTLAHFRKARDVLQTLDPGRPVPQHGSGPDDQ